MVATTLDKIVDHSFNGLHIAFFTYCYVVLNRSWINAIRDNPEHRLVCYFSMTLTSIIYGTAQFHAIVRSGIPEALDIDKPAILDDIADLMLGIPLSCLGSLFFIYFYLGNKCVFTLSRLLVLLLCSLVIIARAIDTSLRKKQSVGIDIFYIVIAAFLIQMEATSYWIWVRLPEKKRGSKPILAYVFISLFSGVFCSIYTMDYIISFLRSKPPSCAFPKIATLQFIGLALIHHIMLVWSSNWEIRVSWGRREASEIAQTDAASAAPAPVAQVATEKSEKENIV